MLPDVAPLSLYVTVKTGVHFAYNVRAVVIGVAKSKGLPDSDELAYQPAKTLPVFVGNTGSVAVELYAIRCG
jgi:hypothetical protein